MNKREALVNPELTGLMHKSRLDPLKKELPTREWGAAAKRPSKSYESMDLPDPRTKAAYSVRPKTDYYLDVGDDKREKD
jgi:hypothetical protein